jgi:hypothetical protein
MRHRRATAAEEYIEEVLAELSAEPDVAKFGERVDAILKANGIDDLEALDDEARRAAYRMLLCHPEIKEQAHQLTEVHAGIYPTPVIVNGHQCGLRELPGT